MLDSKKWLVVMALVALPATAAADNHVVRPTDFTMAIGAGWDLPSDIDIINTASVRFRLANGLTFEPRVELSTDSNKTEVGNADTENTANAVVLSTTARYPMMSRGPTDFIVLGGVNFSRFAADPDGADNNSTTSVAALVWGLSVEWWISQRWAFSFTAINPIVSRVSTTMENAIDDTTTTDFSFGLIFDPNIIAMFHLYY